MPNPINCTAKISALLLFYCFFPSAGFGQISFSTTSASNNVPLYSSYHFAVDIENLPVGAVVKASTKGGIGALVYDNEEDTGRFEITAYDTAYSIDISDNHVRLEIAAGREGIHTHTFCVEIYSGNIFLKSWTRRLEFRVFKLFSCLELAYYPQVYELIETDFNLAVSGISPTEVMISAAGATLKRNSIGYTLVPTVKAGGIVVLNISAKLEDGRMMQVDQKEFMVQPIPDPELLLAFPGPPGSGYPMILAIYPMIHSSPVSVTSWELELTLSGKVKHFKGHGKVLNKKAMKSWKKLRPGDSYLLKNIHVHSNEKNWLLSKQGLIQ